ncbi:RNA polymerase sigma-70 factor [Flexithrix dorotheae]|uniref:RNA polymerase sigma-70 factor n=1 Tax=Flexithrix dorotheae TaxID=70993 RepID=UPI0012FA803C|nr:RNA polymerase sigma-70 factor [Flexithrix dorotheae]
MEKRIQQEREKEVGIETLIDQYGQELQAFAFFFVKNKEIAEEVVSDVFFNIWKLHQSNISKINNIKSYLFNATKNQSLNFLNSPQNYKNQTSVSIPEFPIAIEYFNPENAILIEELKLELNEAIQQLPPRCREIFNLVKMQGMSYQEVANSLQISKNTVKEQMARAIKQLRITIENYENGRDINENRNPLSLSLLILFFL